MHRVFLDANVLFSAAYRPDAGLARLWRLAGVELLTSAYAVEEARANLTDDEQRARLASLVKKLTIVADVLHAPLPPGVTLPEKDRPILASAIRAGATHLLTGDVTHFGRHFRRSIGGVRVLSPVMYLAGTKT